MGSYKDAANVAAYLMGTSETFNQLYYMNKVRDVLVNDSRFKLHNSFGNFRGYSKNVTAVFNEYKVMNSVGKAFGKSMFGVGLALTPPLLVLRVSNGAGLTNKRDKLG